MGYFIRTKKTGYNSVDDAAHFQRIRKNRKDNTAVTEAFKWKSGKGWVRTDKSKFAKHRTKKRRR